MESNFYVLLQVKGGPGFKMASKDGVYTSFPALALFTIFLAIHHVRALPSKLRVSIIITILPFCITSVVIVYFNSEGSLQSIHDLPPFSTI